MVEPANGQRLVVPPGVQAYLDLDLSSNSLAATALRGRLDADRAESGEVVELTSDLDSTACGLTPEMSAWYDITVSHLRQTAIDAVRGEFADDKIRNVPTILLECELDRLHADTLAAKHRALDDFHRSSVQLRMAAQDAKDHFETILAEQGGRKPRMIDPWAYAGGLVAVVVLEIFLNFESFMRVPFIKSPFLATGATLLVALAVGWASHLHGTLLRQKDYYFGPHDKTRTTQGLQILAIGSALLAVSLGAVLGARYYFILPAIQQASLMGVDPPSLAGSLVFMVAGNVMVYLIGCAWAFVTHDDIPDYPSIKRKADASQADYDDEFNRKVVSELGRLDKKAESEEKKLRSRDSTQSASTLYAANKRLFGFIKAKDAQVSALLRDYRAALARRDPKMRYRYPDRSVVTHERSTVLSAGEWAAKEISLRYHSPHLT